MRKYGTVLLFIIAFSIFVILLVGIHPQNKGEELIGDKSLVKLLTKNTIVNITEERQNIFFLKAHKCASSTLQNILMRYGFSRNLDFVLPAVGNYIGNPEFFNGKLIPQPLRSHSGKYNIFTHHTRYNFSATKDVMYPDCAFVTILRNPPDLFESLYSFYHLEKLTKSTFKQFINDPKKHKNLKQQRFLNKIGLNQMSWDLGNNELENLSKAKIKKFIRKIEREFDLVLISEYIEASLVLLCDLMKWPLKHVAFLKLNSRPVNMKNTLNDHERDVISNLNAIDTELYDFFLDKFRQKIHAYGVERMAKDVKQLLKLNSQLWKDCVESPNNKGYARTLNYDIRNNLDWTCFYSTRNELTFTDEIRDDQVRRFTAIKKLETFIEGGVE
ncbi:galactosylceramide sulfotransferase-like [Cimex lectularius]|uniref:Galactose-3-O-sulfotransferase n=1 Tax=Cimex lectularius TaxID=79782 RepID=A0A8I6TE38_CIMLE|nr:galactosylceramide sulfotransferase-like [Cimex lectularius]